MSISLFRRRCAVSAGAVFCLALAGGALAPSSAPAHEMTKGAITVEHPWARINIANRPSAAYAVIHNDAQTEDRIVAARSPAFGRIELHTHNMVDGVMQMRKVEAIVAPAQGKVALEPGGLHIMLFEPKKALKKGDLFDMVLVFEKAGAVEIVVMAEDLAGGVPKKGGHSGDHSGHGAHGSHGSTN